MTRHKCFDKEAVNLICYYKQLVAKEQSLSIILFPGHRVVGAGLNSLWGRPTPGSSIKASPTHIELDRMR
jgi:hypothetical protein